MTLDSQLDLSFSSRRPVATGAEMDALIAYLRGRDWTTAKTISVALRMSDRQIRAVASETPEILSGQKGYKLTRLCTAEEARHAVAWLRSQARQMIGRSIRIAKLFHRLAS